MKEVLSQGRVLATVEFEEFIRLSTFAGKFTQTLKIL